MKIEDNDDNEKHNKDIESIEKKAVSEWKKKKLKREIEKKKKAKTQAKIEERWTLAEMLSEYLTKNIEKWEEERLKRMKEEQKTIEEWEKLKRHKKIKRIKIEKKKTEKDKRIEKAEMKGRNWKVWRETGDNIEEEDDLETPPTRQTPQKAKVPTLKEEMRIFPKDGNTEPSACTCIAEGAKLQDMCDHIRSLLGYSEMGDIVENKDEKEVKKEDEKGIKTVETEQNRKPKKKNKISEYFTQSAKSTPPSPDKSEEKSTRGFLKAGSPVNDERAARIFQKAGSTEESDKAGEQHAGEKTVTCLKAGKARPAPTTPENTFQKAGKATRAPSRKTQHFLKAGKAATPPGKRKSNLVCVKEPAEEAEAIQEPPKLETRTSKVRLIEKNKCKSPQDQAKKLETKDKFTTEPELAIKPGHVHNVMHKFTTKAIVEDKFTSQKLAANKFTTNKRSEAIKAGHVQNTMQKFTTEAIRDIKLTTHKPDKSKFTTDTGDTKPSEASKFTNVKQKVIKFTNKNLDAKPENLKSKLGVKNIRNGKIEKLKVKTKSKPKSPASKTPPISLFFKTIVPEFKIEPERDKTGPSESTEHASDPQLCTLPHSQPFQPSSTKLQISSISVPSNTIKRLVNQYQTKQM